VGKENPENLVLRKEPKEDKKTQRKKRNIVKGGGKARAEARRDRVPMPENVKNGKLTLSGGIKARL